MGRLRTEDLFERHHPAIFRFALRSTGDRQVAEDLAQDVFLRAVSAAASYREIGEERAWLFRIARNLLVDRSRRAARRPRPVALDPTAETAREIDPAERTGLLRALEELPAPEREAFLLSQLGGLRYREIAEITGATEPAVRSRIFRARMALRERLAPTPRGDAR